MVWPWGEVGQLPSGGCAASASRTGYPLLDRRLSLPEEWFDAAHRERWQPCGLPEEPRFAPTPAWALEMLRAVGAAGTLRFRGVTCDEAFGRDTACLDGVAAQQRWDDAEVPHDTQSGRPRPATAVPAWSGRGRWPRQGRVVPGAPAPQRVDQLAAAVPTDGWQPFLITEGSKGLLGAACTFPRGVAGRAGLPGPDVWVVLRRALGETPERKVSLRHAPAHTPVTGLVRVAGRRWPIATAFEERKGGLGLAHYEVRSWWGWHHHRTRCLWAHHCLVRARQRVKKGRRH